MLRFALLVLFLPAYVVVASLAGCLLTWLLGTPSPLYRFSRFGILAALFIAGIRIRVEGVATDFRNSVIVANHQSHLDAPLMFVAMNVDMKAVAKKEIFQLPFFGRVIRMAGFVSVDRTDTAQAKRAVDDAVAALTRGECFLVFPEGTRSRTGDLGEFKKGGFIAAIQARSRVIPVAVIGSRELMARGTLLLRPGTIRFRVLEPVDAGRYSYEDRDRLASEVRSRIAAALAEASATAA